MGVIGASLSEPHIDHDNVPRRGECLYLSIYLSMYLFCANRGSGPSMDCLAQTVDRALSGQTVDRLRKAWIKLAQSVDVGQTVDSYC